MRDIWTVVILSVSREFGSRRDCPEEAALDMDNARMNEMYFRLHIFHFALCILWLYSCSRIVRAQHAHMVQTLPTLRQTKNVNSGASGIGGRVSAVFGGLIFGWWRTYSGLATSRRIWNYISGKPQETGLLENRTAGKYCANIEALYMTRCVMLWNKIATKYKIIQNISKYSLLSVSASRGPFFGGIGLTDHDKT